MAPEFAPDLVIIDVMMPDMDGPFTLRLLRETAGLRDTPVVFLTTKAQPTEVVRYRALGAVDVLAKPLTIGPWSSRSGDFLTTLARRAKGWTEKSPPSRLGLPPDCPSGLARSSARGRTLATADGDAAAMLRIVVHRLAGSASSFGYGKIGDIARGLERLLERVFDDGERPNPEETSDIKAYIAALRRELP